MIHVWSELLVYVIKFLSMLVYVWIGGCAYVDEKWMKKD